MFPCGAAESLRAVDEPRPIKQSLQDLGSIALSNEARAEGDPTLLAGLHIDLIQICKADGLTALLFIDAPAVVRRLEADRSLHPRRRIGGIREVDADAAVISVEGTGEGLFEKVKKLLK